MRPDISNALLMEVLLEELASRSMTMEDFEQAQGIKPGEMTHILSPPDERAINRNIKLTAMYLGIPGKDFFEILWKRAEPEGNG